MKYLIMSDIHGNLEALTEAMNISKKLSPDKILVLGDIVGYMCNPNECIDLVKNYDCIMGNHDYAVNHPEMLGWFNSMAKQALEWTAKSLKNDNREFLDKLPYKRNYEKFTIVHGDITKPQKFNYILKNDYILNSNFDMMPSSILFAGHTHFPYIFARNIQKHITCTSVNGEYEINLDTVNNKYIINVGSIGQPRDGSTNGCFILFDDCTYMLKYVRFRYNIDSAVKKMIENHMPEPLYRRLYHGR